MTDFFYIIQLLLFSKINKYVKQNVKEGLNYIFIIKIFKIYISYYINQIIEMTTTLVHCCLTKKLLNIKIYLLCFKIQTHFLTKINKRINKKSSMPQFSLLLQLSQRNSSKNKSKDNNSLLRWH